MPADRITNSLRTEIKQWKSFKNSFLEVSVQTSFAKTNTAHNEFQNPSYSLVNLGLGTSFAFEDQLLNVTVTCSNLINEVYADFMSRLRTIGANNMGRNIVLSVKIPFNLSY